MLPLLAVAAVSAAYTIYSAEQQAAAMEDKANFDREMMRLNAERAEMDAAQVIRDGESDKVKYLSQVDRSQAKTEEILAVNDIKNSGAVADLQAESKLNATLNMVDIGYNAFMSSAKFKREANQNRAQGEVDYMAGNTNANNTRISGYASAVGIAGSAWVNSSKGSK